MTKIVFFSFFYCATLCLSAVFAGKTQSSLLDAFIGEAICERHGTETSLFGFGNIDNITHTKKETNHSKLQAVRAKRPD